jgi:hypothetical protein
MMGRHGLGDPAIKERARLACRFDTRRRGEFQSFLLGEGRLLPSMAIARQWGLAQKTVTAYRRRLGIQLSWGEARCSDDYRRQQRKRAAAFIAHTRARWRQWRERRKLDWEKLRRELARRPDCPPVRVCQCCGEQWYAAREFFHMRTRRTPRGVKVSYCRICRLCRAERRRNPAVAHALAGAHSCGD